MPQELYDRFRKHLPKSNDITLVVLKGHLLLEESMNNLLDTLLKKPKELNNANLRFHQKLCLLKAMRPAKKGLQSDAWNAIEQLNSIRNKLAHKLEPPKIEELIKDFISTIEDSHIPKSVYKKESIEKRLRGNIVFLCGFLDGFSIGIKATKP